MKVWNQHSISVKRARHLRNQCRILEERLRVRHLVAIWCWAPTCPCRGLTLFCFESTVRVTLWHVTANFPGFILTVMKVSRVKVKGNVSTLNHDITFRLVKWKGKATSSTGATSHFTQISNVWFSTKRTQVSTVGDFIDTGNCRLSRSHSSRRCSSCRGCSRLWCQTFCLSNTIKVSINFVLLKGF